MSSPLSLNGLDFRYPSAVEATLSGIQLTVPAGSMTAVLGASGSGKSTLLRVVAGLLPILAGRVHLGAADVTDLPAERRGVAMMFQKAQLFPHLDVLDNVAYPQRIRGRSRTVARAGARDLLELVQLADLAHRRPRELSGGQEQRVALARCLAAQPAVLLLDEPFSALDVELRAAMHTLLDEVRATLSPTTVLVTHDLTEASRADTVAVLDRGRIVQHAAMSELYRAPATVSVARLLGGFNELPTRRTPDGLVTPLGLAPDPDTTGGEPVVLLRQESLQVLDPGADGIDGVVEQVWWVGARQHARITVCSRTAMSSPGLTVTAEVPLGQHRAAGDRVAVRRTGPFISLPVPSHPSTADGHVVDAQAPPSVVTTRT